MGAGKAEEGTRCAARSTRMRAMNPISPAERRVLKARAHALNPVVIVSGAGLSASVIAEIDRCLKAHELIKIRVFSDDRLQRESLLEGICERTGASPVQHIGKILVVYRQNPESPTPQRARTKPKAPARGQTARARSTRGAGRSGPSKRAPAPGRPRRRSTA
jgi:RNA-binding protein